MGSSIKLKRKMFFAIAPVIAATRGALAGAGGGSALGGALNAVNAAGMAGTVFTGIQSNSVAKETTAATNKANLQAANIQKKTEEQRIKSEQKIAEQNNKALLEKAKIDAKAQVDASKAASDNSSSLLPSFGSSDTTTSAGALANNMNMELGNVANNPNTAQQASQAGFSESSFRKTKSRQKLFGWGGVIKDLGKVVWSERGSLSGHAISGALMGAAGVGVGSAINAHMKSQGIDVNAMKEDIKRQEALQKQMSNSDVTAIAEHVAENEGSSISSALKSGIKSAPMGLALSALIEVPNVISYNKNLDTLKARYGKNITKSSNEEAQKNCSKTSIKLKRKVSQKSFGFTAGKYFDLKGFMSHPGKSILGFASHLAMAGGNKTADSVTKKIIEQGNKSGNATTVKVGEWFRDHPKTALAASIPIGIGVMKATFDLGDEAAKKVADKINPDWNTYNKWSEMNG